MHCCRQQCATSTSQPPPAPPAGYCPVAGSSEDAAAAPPPARPGGWARFKGAAKALKREVLALYFAMEHPRTPLLSKVLPFFVLAYALSPLDLIPDFIPVLGILDDLLLLPGLLWLCIRLIPEDVMEESRRRAEEEPLWLDRNWLVRRRAAKPAAQPPRVPRSRRRAANPALLVRPTARRSAAAAAANPATIDFAAGGHAHIPDVAGQPGVGAGLGPGALRRAARGAAV